MRVSPKIIMRAKGRHSHIPACCIDFFVEKFEPPLEVYRAGAAWSGQYIPCPDCLKKNTPVELHVCTESCWTRVQQGELSPIEVGTGWSRG